MRVASTAQYPQVVGLLRFLADALDFEISSSQFLVHRRRVPSGTLITSMLCTKRACNVGLSVVARTPAR